MSDNYTQKIELDDGTIAYDLPRNVILPEDESKYIRAPWRSHYSLFKLSYLIYGDTSKFYLLMAANGITNPYQELKTFRFLRPDYLNEVRFK